MSNVENISDHFDDETDEEAFSRLANLSRLDYERVRQSEAGRLGIRVSVLDQEVSQYRENETPLENSLQGRPIEFELPPAWEEQVYGDELLDDIERLFDEYTILPTQAATVLALWVLFSYLFDVFSHAPRLLITSPQKGCGKTTLMGLLTALVLKPLAASNVSAAALFRVIESARPTLLIDEGDTFINDNEILRGVINSGHSKQTAFVIRTVSDDHLPMQFSTWAAMVIAQIGNPPETILDRSISILMERKRPDEQIARFNPDNEEISELLSELRSKAVRWAEDNIEELREHEPAMPEFLHNRREDNWRPLISIADICGGGWPEKARNAARRLCEGNQQEDTSVAVSLLTDIKQIFENSEATKLTTEEILRELHRMVERPWPEWRNAKPLTDRQMARILNPYRLSSKTIRIRDTQRKGYILSDFEDAFRRYLPVEPEPPVRRRDRTNPRRTTNNRWETAENADWDAGTDK